MACSDESRIGLEAYESGCRARPLESLGAARPPCLHRARPVGADAELAEVEARAAVDAHREYALRCECFVDPVEAQELARRWNEEGGTGAAEPGPRLGRRRFLPEGRREG